jgi:N-carbamoyl-D-amino-acid hydrolase
MPSAATAPLFDDAKRYGIGLYIGYAELVEEAGRLRRFNTAILVSPDGRDRRQVPQGAPARPRRAQAAGAFQHLEKKYFEVGDLGFNTWRMLDTITGMLICNDRRWPEAFRALTLQGAELVALGFNTPSENLHYPEPPALRVHHHLIMAQAMAFMNATWLVETAKCGFEDGFRMFGHSLIVAPSGEIVAKTVSEDDELISFDADLDLAQDLKRTMFNYAAHRRPEHYRILIDRVGAEVTPKNG